MEGKNIVKKAAIGAALIVAAAGAVLFYKNNIAMNPGETLLKYMSYAEDGEYEKMYALLDEDSQKGITKKEFIKRNKNIYKGIGLKTLDATVTSKKRETTVTYHVKMRTSAGVVTYNNKTVFVKENRRYRMEWDDSVIFPELGAEDKVRVKTLRAKRGTIKDASGKALAVQGKIYSVGFVPGKMDQNSVKLASKKLGISKEEIEKRLDQKWVTEDSFVPLTKLKEYSADLLDVKGIIVSTETGRIYPLGEAAAHLVGYMQNGEGKAGLEKLYDKRLSGKDGLEIYIEDSNGQKKQELAVKAQTNGKNLKTTIDSSLQKSIYEQYKNDKSVHTAINPSTGAVKALVSTPSYDAQAFILGMTQEKWDKINNDERHPMQNRFKGTFVPGSSMKPIIAAIGLSQKKFTASEDFGSSGKRWQKDKSWGGYYVTTLHDYKDHNLQNALIYSDNIYFAKAALKIGKDTLKDQFDNLGFGKTMDFTFGLTASSYGSDGFTSEIQLADSGYGQGKMMVNPVHMAAIYTAFSNDGNMIKPYLIREKQNKKQILKENVFSKDAVNTVNTAMRQVISNPNGTGHAANIEGIQLRGKTGTAEIKQTQTDTKGTELGWFVTIMPKTNKKDALELISMTEDVKKRGGSGYVVNKTKKILQEYLQ